MTTGLVKVFDWFLYLINALMDRRTTPSKAGWGWRLSPTTLRVSFLKDLRFVVIGPTKEKGLLWLVTYLLKKNTVFCVVLVDRHSKESILKFETVIPRKGIMRPQYQFPHSCVCARFIYSYSAAVKLLGRSWKYINHPQTHECRNWDWGRAIPRKGIHKWDFCCSASPSINLHHVSL